MKRVDGKNTLICTTVPRTNVVPQSGLFYTDYTDALNTIRYREVAEYGTWILEFNGDGLGLLNKAVPHVLFKKFAASCWSELCEIYGIPPRVLKTNTQDRGMLDRGERMMKDMGAAAYFIIDKDELLEFADVVSTNGDVYKNLIQFCNNELSLLVSGAVIGQDTKNGNYSKEIAGQEMQWLLVQSDMRLIEDAYTNTILPALARIGIIKPGRRFRFMEAENTEQLYKFTTGFITTGRYRANPEWIKEKFGVEVEEIQPNEPATEKEKDKEKDKKFTADPLKGFFD